jgi:hypothetical protein
VPSSLPTREGLLIRACDTVALQDGAITYAVETQLKQSVTNFPAGEQIDAAYELFYPGMTPSDAVRAALAGVVQTSRDKDFHSRDSWRFLLLTLCLSPGWQIH